MLWQEFRAAELVEVKEFLVLVICFETMFRMSLFDGK